MWSEVALGRVGQDAGGGLPSVEQNGSSACKAWEGECLCLSVPPMTKSPVKERAQPSREEITVDTKLSPETRANGVGQVAWRRRAQGEARPLWIWC